MSINTDTDSLREEIVAAFPQVEMPSHAELILHSKGCAECADLLEDLEQYRGKKVDEDLIRLVHQELSHLSAKSWRWLLPSYLTFCLTPEAAYSRMETEFLIYNLGPDLRFQAETVQRLSLLNGRQRSCLIDFLVWCSNHEFWKEYCPENITKAMNFLKTLQKPGG